MTLLRAILALSLMAAPAVAQQPSAPAQKSAPAAPKATPAQKTAPAAKAATPAPSAAQKAPPAAAGSPALQGARQVYAAMPEAERIAIQYDLIWSGHHVGLANGDFNDRSVNAVKAFQKANGGKDTGILNPQERTALSNAGKAALERTGWRIVNDAATGTRIGLPLKLAPQSSQAKAGTRWSAAQGQVQVETFRARDITLQALFDQEKKTPPDRKVDYNIIRPDFFVITGLQGLKKFYQRASIKDGEIRGYTVSYDQAMDGVMNPIVIAMSSAFAAFPPPTVATVAVPPPRRKVEYATGIVVSNDGHVVVDRYATEGCSAIIVPTHGDADRIAEDKVADLALLRLYGAEGLAPLPVANAARGPDVTLVGIADPQSQGGRAAITRTVVRINDQALDPAPPQGFAGAAAIDSDGRLAGLVALKPQPAFVASDTLRKFLVDQQIKVVSSGTVNPSSAIVRVICIRK